MSTGYGPLSTPSATSDAYRDNWERIHGKKQSEPQHQLTELEEAKRQRDVFKQLLEASMEALQPESVLYVTISEALEGL